MSRETQLAKNTAIISIGTILPKAAAFITLPVLTGWLTQEEYGTYDLVTVMVSLLLPALVLRVHDAAFRFLIDSRNDDERTRAIISDIYAVIVPVSLFALLVLFFTLGAIADALARLLVCFYFLADIFSVSLRQIARGLGRPLDYSVSAVVSAAGKVVFALALVLGAGLGLYGAVVSLAASSACSVVYLSVRLRIWRYISLKYINRELLRQMLGYSWPLVPNEVALWVVRMADRVIITAFMGLAANAVYAVATKIPQLISLAQGAFTLAWQENATIASKDEDAKAYYTSMFKTMYGLQAGFFGAVMAASPLLFLLLIRGDYNDAYQYIPLLCLGTFFSTMATFLGGIYIAHMKSKSVGITTTVAAAVSVALDVALIGPFGLWAPAAAMFASFLVLFVYRAIDVRKTVAIEYDLKYMTIVTAVLVLECVLCAQRSLPFDAANCFLAAGSFIAFNMPVIKAVARKVSTRIRNKQSSKGR